MKCARPTTAHWVGEGDGKPTSSMSFTRQSPLDPTKIIVLSVFTMELLREPGAESIIRRELLRASAAGLDSAFLNPENTGEVAAGEVIKPASIFAQGTATGSSSPPTDFYATLEELLGVFTGSAERAVLIMDPEQAAELSSATYPLVGARGGTLAGFPTLVSSNVPMGVVGIADPDSIALVLPDTEAAVRTSMHGSIEMEDSAAIGQASAPTVGATNLVSLFSSNSVGVIVERVANWKVLVATDVVYIAD